MFCLRPVCPLSTPVASVQYIRTPSSPETYPIIRKRKTFRLYKIIRNVALSVRTTKHWIRIPNKRSPHDMPMQTQRGGGGLAPTIRHPALEGGWWSAPRSSRFDLRKDPVTTALEVGWASRSFRTAQKIARHRDSIPEPPILYRVAVPTSLYQIANITMKM
jgi:hypothetical protein